MRYIAEYKSRNLVISGTRFRNWGALASILVISSISSLLKADTLQGGPNFVVNSLSDSNDGEAGVTHCSLREAILAANANADASEISFDPALSGTITLTAALPALSTAITINGPSLAPGISISGAGSYQVILITASGSVNVHRLTIVDGLGTNGTVAGEGGTAGGLHITGNGTHTITGCYFTNNRGGVGNGQNNPNTGRGGGGGLQSNGGGTVTVANCTFYANFGGNPGTGGRGGAGGVQVENGTFNFRSCTVANNVGAAGSGTGFGGSGGMFTINVGPFMWNNVLTSNTGGAPGGGAGATDFGGTMNSNGHNLLGSTLGTNVSVLLATDLQNANARLDSPQDNGGPTRTMKLLVGSAAIDKGKTPPGVTSDQRGLSRPRDFAGLANASSGDGSDIGAYEEQTSPGVPMVTPLSLAGFSGSPVTGQLNAVDYDSPNPLNYTKLTDPSNGTVTVSSSGAVSYTSVPGFTGVVTFTVKGNNGVADSAPETVTISVSEAQSLVVTTLADDSTSLDNQTSLREAVAFANSNADQSNISFAPGLTGTITLASVLPTLSSNLAITGPATAPGVTLSGANASQILAISGGTVSISSLTFANGKGTAGTDAVNSGQNGQPGTAGGIAVSGGTVTVSACTFTGCIGGAGGKGANGANGSFGPGGGGSPGGDGGGGAINCTNGTTLITNCTFVGNTGGAGGNSGSGGNGGFSYPPYVYGNGGPAGPAGNGGAGGVSVRFGTVTLSNSTLVGNSAGDSGVPGTAGMPGDANGMPGLYTSAPPRTGGGATRTGGTFTIGNSLIAGNTGSASGSGTAKDLSGGVFTNGFNLVGAADGSTGLTHATDQKGTIASPLNAMVETTLASNGGPTKTLKLLTGSPAQDRGKALNSATTDQRGESRPYDEGMISNATGGDGSDIGAFEAQAAPPTPVYVTTTADMIDAGDGVLSLREAIIEANSDPNTSIISFDATAFPSPGPHTIQLESALPTITTNINFEGPGADILTIRGEGAPSGFGSDDFYRFLDIASGGTVSISGITIDNFRAAGTNGLDGTSTGVGAGTTGADPPTNGQPGYGGAIRNAGSLAISDCVITNCHAQGGAGGFGAGNSNQAGANGANGYGGAIYSNGSSLTVLRCSFSGTTALGGSGGSGANILYAGGQRGPGGNAADGYGGAIYAEGTGTASISTSTFYGTGAYGGFGGGGGATFTGNFLAGGTGGDGSGGAIYAAQAVTVTSCTTVSCTAAAGNGGYQGDGGGSNAQAGDARGAGLYGGATITVGNSLIAANNLGPQGSGAAEGSDVFGTFSSQNYNLVSILTSHATGFTGSADQTGTSANPIDAKADPQGLKNNGGHVTTLSLRKGSPAVDKGNGTGLDQRQNVRPMDLDNAVYPNAAGGNGNDIGAFESQSFPNEVPVIAQTTQSITAYVNSPISSQPLQASDADSDSLTFSLASGTMPGGLTFNADGIVTGTPMAPGQTTVTFKVNDGLANSNTATLNITVYEAASLVVNTDVDNSTAYDGLTSLREAINTAANDGVSTPVTFDATFFGAAKTITLASQSIAISADVTVEGSSSGVTISGGNVVSLFAIFGGTVNLNKLTLADGKAAAFSGGGAISAMSFGGAMTVNLTDCTLKNNSAEDGSGGAVNNMGANITLTNCTLVGNQATSTGAAPTAGGAINLYYGSVTVHNCTITGNNAGTGSGGAIANQGGTVNLGNSIVAGNTAASSIDIHGAVVSQGFNIIGSSTGATVTGTATGNQTGVDPKLDTAGLTSNEGPTQTIKLLSGSPALDKGKALGGATTDQRGKARPYDDPAIANATEGDGSDIGAFEQQAISGDTPKTGPNFIVTTLDDHNDGIAGVNDCTLREAIYAANSFPNPDGSNPGVITFAAGLTGKIALTQGVLPTISAPVMIMGPGAATLAVSGSGISIILVINDNVGTVLISGLTFTEAQSFNEGAVVNLGGNTLTVTDCAFVDNKTTAAGAGLYNYSGANVMNCVFSGNVADATGGGFANHGTAIVTQCTFTGNSAGSFGGGGFYSTDEAILTSCTFVNNNATDQFGGAVLSLGKMTINNCTLSGNSAMVAGGAVGNGGEMWIQNSTIANNLSGAVVNIGSVGVGNSIFSNNTGGNFVNDDANGATIGTDGWNLSSDDDSAILSHMFDQNSTDPLLDPAGLADNGGVTQTIKLLAGSPAMDRGQAMGGVTTDQRLMERPKDHAVLPNTTYGDGSDIGAYEEQATPVLPTPTPVTFSASSYAVFQGATSVALTLSRTDSSTSGSLKINTDNGTVTVVPPFSAAVATAAAASSDYVDLKDANTTVTFAIGETSKTVTVTLIPKTGTVPNKRFSATISAPTTGLSLGATTTTIVRILSEDNVGPTLNVTKPAASTTTANGAASTYAVEGITTDSRGIDRIEIAVNGAAAVPATQGSPVGVSIPFHLDVTLTPGPNTIDIMSYDLRGNVTTVTRNLTFSLRHVLTVARDVPSSLLATPDTAGVVNLAATPSTGASALSPSAANSNPKTSELTPGTSVRLTATSKTGYAFSNWSGLPSGATIDGNIVEFIMASSNVDVTAVFVANPFAPLGGADVDFYGLIQPTGGAARSVETEGFLSATINAASGALTGKVLVGGSSQSFTGTVFGDGSVKFNVSSTLASDLTFGTRTLNMSYNAGSGNNELAVTLTNSAGSSTSTGIVRRSIYSNSSLVDASFPGLINTTGSTPALSKGIFTVGFSAKAQTPVRATSQYPQGDGYATVTLNNSGSVIVSGTLADGTTVSGSSAVVTGNECPIYIQMLTPGSASAKGAVLMGTLVFDSSQTNTDVTGMDLLWLRPSVTETSGTTAAALATQRYTDGWPDGVTVDAAGALYDNSVEVQTMLDLGAADPTIGNGRIVFEDGKLTAPLTKTNFNITGSTVTKIPTADSTLNLVVTPATGLISGSFTPNWANPAAAKPAIKGILIQKGANKGGFGHFISNAVGDSDQEAGGVTLSKQ